MSAIGSIYTATRLHPSGGDATVRLKHLSEIMSWTAHWTRSSASTDLGRVMRRNGPVGTLLVVALPQ